MNNMPKQWVLASSNAGKLQEFQALFNQFDIALKCQTDFNVQACDEPHCTFVENALVKARHASKNTNLPALADDSGLCVPALKGAPGVLSARYSVLNGGEPGDHNNNQMLIKNLADVADPQAYYVCALVWVEHEFDPTPVVAQRYWWGQLQTEAEGENGFGYDPHFRIPSKGCTAAQLLSQEKNRLSHRALAMQALMQELTLRFKRGHHS